MSAPDLKLRRVMLKLSGEALCGDTGYGVDPATLRSISMEVGEVHALGAEVALVIGGGNIFRGLRGSAQGMDRASADYMGMLATVINALALADAIQACGAQARVMSPFTVGGYTEPFSARVARRHLVDGHVVLLSGGTGNPFFTTDTTAALRAAEVGADVLVKATKVDGVYSADPRTNPDAERYAKLTYRDVIERNLGVMDITAITLCMENEIPVVVCDLWQPGAVQSVLAGDQSTGTWIGSA